tara:strand:- start:116 stop:427 length:312 start_codon:yes stop_codon:yes gene_type:complete
MDANITLQICTILLISALFYWVLFVVRRAAQELGELVMNLDNALGVIAQNFGLTGDPNQEMPDRAGFELKQLFVDTLKAALERPTAEVRVIEKDESGKFKKIE